jgi:hypothetical protein
MAENKIVMAEKGRTYTVTGELCGPALACFTALSAFRIVRGLILALCGASGASAAIIHFLHR